MSVALCQPLVAAACRAAQAIGPVVQVTSGDVLVNTGEGFHSIGTGTPLEPGSQLLASPNSSVMLVYPDGTLVPVQPGAFTLVAEVPGGVGAPSGWQTAVMPGPEEATGLATAGAGAGGAGIPASTLLVIGGIGAAAAGAVAIASGGGNSAPASP